MSAINLNSYTGVHTSLFVRIEVTEYRSEDEAGFIPYVLRFTDHYLPLTINSELYNPVGNLMKVTSSRSELRASANSVTITLSGIPQDATNQIIYSKIKSAPVRIFRGFFDVNTYQIIGQPIGRYRGFVNNYAINEEYDVVSKRATNTLTLDCSASVDILGRKLSGRKSNPKSMKRYYPTDVSMDKVPNLENATFDFGSKWKDNT